MIVFVKQELLIGQRMMTISTVGVPNTIARLATHKLQSTLAIRYLQSVTPDWHDNLSLLIAQDNAFLVSSSLHLNQFIFSILILEGHQRLSCI